jgi:hypothetical protein
MAMAREMAKALQVSGENSGKWMKMAGLWWRILEIPEIYTEDLKKS